MRFQLAAAALIAGAVATYDTPPHTPKNHTSAYPEYPKWTTEVVTSYTTYCPSPTKISHGGVTYTVTKATTLTITDCPCTVTKPVPVPSAGPPAPPAPPAPPGAPSAPPAGPPAPPAPPAAPTTAPPAGPPAPVPYPSGNATVPAPPAGTGSTPTGSSPPEFTGAATKIGAGAVAIIAGLAAFL